MKIWKVIYWMSLVKTCTKCKIEKSDAEFIKSGTQRHSMCDPCRKQYQREYQQKLTKRRNNERW